MPGHAAVYTKPQHRVRLPAAPGTAVAVRCVGNAEDSRCRRSIQLSFQVTNCIKVPLNKRQRVDRRQATLEAGLTHEGECAWGLGLRACSFPRHLGRRHRERATHLGKATERVRYDDGKMELVVTLHAHVQGKVTIGHPLADESTPHVQSVCQQSVVPAVRRCQQPHAPPVPTAPARRWCLGVPLPAVPHHR